MSEPNAYGSYRKLRFAALTTPAETVADVEPGAPYGVVMEIGYAEGVATLAAFADGNASLYFSNGGGVVGGFAHEVVRAAAKEFVDTARPLAGAMDPTPVLPLPPASLVRFYLLTSSGLLTDQAGNADLTEGKHALSPLFFAGHEVITHLRRLAQRLPSR